MIGQVIAILVVYGLLTLGLIINAGLNIPVIGVVLAQTLWVLLLIYDTKCLVEGNCNTWAWIRTIFLLIVPIIAVVILLGNGLLTDNINPAVNKDKVDDDLVK